MIMHGGDIACHAQVSGCSVYLDYVNARDNHACLRRHVDFCLHFPAAVAGTGTLPPVWRVCLWLFLFIAAACLAGAETAIT